ncbi:MAG: hypothetical protein U0263_06135 [Polyangiaceae bacterium]
MELVKLSCNGCGADLDVPDDARFVTCRYCAARLEVGHTDGVAFTRVREAVARVEKKTERLADEVRGLQAANRALALERELDALEKQWESEREGLMVRSKDGTLSVPTETSAWAMGAVAIVVGIGAAAMMRGDSSLLLGFVIALLGAGAALIQQQKAARYTKAHAAYLERRDGIEERLAKAKRKAKKLGRTP